MRLHTEKVGPPRALWVPFELGRPLGAPDEPDFQKRVIVDALSLLARTDSPVLEDFPDDAPAGATAEDDEGWVCPISLPAPDQPDDPNQAVLDEIEALRSWYDLAVDRRGRTAVGTSGMSMEDVVRYFAAWIGGETPDNPIEGNDDPTTLRLACDDLKAYYTESAAAQPGRSGVSASSEDLQNWLWTETLGGNLILQLKEALSGNENQMVAVVGQALLVPYQHAHRKPA